jgi:hypothetical protein
MSEFKINYEKLTGDIHQLISEYYKQNILRISEPKFHDIMIINVTDQIIKNYQIENFELIRELVEEQHDKLFNQRYDYIKRTNDHYIGNAYRIEFDQCEDMALLYVSKKLEIVNKRANFGISSDKKSWIYTVGKMLYENETGAKIGKSGLIQHPTIPSIICEFDGIIENAESPLYGRIVKINNVQTKYNIGVPYEEAWIQLQMQMACCDLQFCDYVETQIKEYETEEDFFADEERTKGLILILENSRGTFYKYMPVRIGTIVEEINGWMEKAYSPEYTFVNAIFWYLENYEITLVVRNENWLNKSTLSTL